jgi:molybdopterin synthase catalytic subunit
MKRVFVQQEDFDPGAVQAELESLAPGAIAAFTGLVRNDGGMTGLTLEHYPGMTEAMLHALADQAIERWSLQGICIVHRIGSLKIGDRIVLVVCASAHRAAALEACSFVMDQLKTKAPFWKREERASGSGNWVSAKVADDEAAEKWSLSSPRNDT